MILQIQLMSQNNWLQDREVVLDGPDLISWVFKSDGALPNKEIQSRRD